MSMAKEEKKEEKKSNDKAQWRKSAREVAAIWNRLQNAQSSARLDLVRPLAGLAATLCSPNSSCHSKV